jgi:hypothetical protein
MIAGAMLLMVFVALGLRQVATQRDAGEVAPVEVRP